MEVEIRDDATGNPIYLYYREFKLTEINVERLMSKYLSLVDTLISSFAKTKHFTDVFFMWERSKPQEMKLIKRLEEELEAPEQEKLTKLFMLFETTLRKGLKEINLQY